MLSIANDAPLPEWLGHPLQGDWGDFLLINQVEGNAVVFVRAGSEAIRPPQKIG